MKIAFLPMFLAIFSVPSLMLHLILCAVYTFPCHAMPRQEFQQIVYDVPLSFSIITFYSEFGRKLQNDPFRGNIMKQIKNSIDTPTYENSLDKSHLDWFTPTTFLFSKVANIDNSLTTSDANLKRRFTRSPKPEDGGNMQEKAMEGAMNGAEVISNGFKAGANGAKAGKDMADGAKSVADSAGKGADMMGSGAEVVQAGMNQGKEMTG